MKSLVRRSLAGLIGLALATVPSLACASPPDPSWAPGLWDDGDHDDAVIRVTSLDGDSARDALSGVRLILTAIGSLAADPRHAERRHPASVVLARAPPAASPPWSLEIARSNP